MHQSSHGKTQHESNEGKKIALEHNELVWFACTLIDCEIL